MKKNILISIVFLIISFSGVSQSTCLLPEYEDNCSGLVKSIFDDYIYLRSRAFNSELKEEVMFSVNLKRDILYVFYVCELGGKDNMAINLYDSNDKKVASSINMKSKKNTKIIAFKPDGPGKYYISPEYTKNEKNCCLILLGMITKNIDHYIAISKK